MQGTNTKTEMPNGEHEPERNNSRISSNLSPRFWIAFAAMAITNLAAALDATTLSVALPVKSLFHLPPSTHTNTQPGNIRSHRRLRDRSVLGRDIVSPRIDHNHAPVG